MTRITILGVPIDAVTRYEAVQLIESALHSERRLFITTPNPEMLVLAQRDSRFAEVMRTADLAVPDGVGLLFAARFLGKRLPERVTGVDLVGDIAAFAAHTSKKVFLLGAEEGIAAAAGAELQRRHPGLHVVGAITGGKTHISKDGRVFIDESSVQTLRAAAPDILLVAFGHGVQERWIRDTLPALPSVRLAVGIGGAFDFIAGNAKRAPAWMGKVGLEWLWRLITEPWRAKRIWNAVVVFPWLVITRRD